MGLLDEAIREHLELKLRNGADPQQVALEEREALEPVQVDPTGETPYAEDSPAVFDEHAVYEEHPGVQGAPDALPQETVEFDMSTVMELPEEHSAPHPDEQAQPGQEQLGLE
jgi:hypothetical protein